MRPAHLATIPGPGVSFPWSGQGRYSGGSEGTWLQELPKARSLQPGRAGSWVVAEPPGEFDVQPGLGTRNQIFPFVLKVKKRASWGQPAGLIL